MIQTVWSGIQAKKVGLEPLSSLWWVLTSIKRGFCLLSIALLLLTPRAKIHQNELRGFLLLQTVLRTIASTPIVVARKKSVASMPQG